MISERAKHIMRKALAAQIIMFNREKELEGKPEEKLQVKIHGIAENKPLMKEIGKSRYEQLAAKKSYDKRRKKEILG